MNFIYRLIRLIVNKITDFFSQYISLLLFYSNNITFVNSIKFHGIPIISIQGTFIIGKNFHVNSQVNANPIGRTYKCMFIVRKNAKLEIGNNVGLSGTTIVCQKNIILGNDIKIGGNVCIYDTDFHSLSASKRINSMQDAKYTTRATVIIMDNVFIGAHSTILKGVTIGKNSIIGACSVVTKNIPPNEIWAGNPIRYIRKLNDDA